MIAWYVHHHGSGHTHRALAIARHVGKPVVGLSSAPAPEGWPGAWVTLPPDSPVPDPAVSDVTAGSTLHWAPLRHGGLRRRMAAIGALLGAGDVELVVADVSVEVAVLSRLHGVPVAVVAQPGDRTDRAHRTAYDLAAALLAPWPVRPEPSWSPQWVAKTIYLGGLSRYDDRSASSGVGVGGGVGGGGGGGRRVLVLLGSGGADVAVSGVAEAAAATPGWQWTAAGTLPGAPSRRLPPNLRLLGWADDTWSLLLGSDVVVTHAGQNAVAEVAAARRAAVVIPQDRPHGEQAATARILASGNLAVVEDRWPSPAAWGGVLDLALSRGGDGWRRWSDGQGARRAAAAIEAVLAGSDAGPAAVPGGDAPGTEAGGR